MYFAAHHMHAEEDLHRACEVGQRCDEQRQQPHNHNNGRACALGQPDVMVQGMDDDQVPFQRHHTQMENGRGTEEASHAQRQRTRHTSERPSAFHVGVGCE